MLAAATVFFSCATFFLCWWAFAQPAWQSLPDFWFHAAKVAGGCVDGQDPYTVANGYGASYCADYPNLFHVAVGASGLPLWFWCWALVSVVVPLAAWFWVGDWVAAAFIVVATGFWAGIVSVATFPEAMLAVWWLLALGCARRKWWLGVVACVALAGLTHRVGLAVLLPIGLGLLEKRLKLGVLRVFSVVTVALPVSQTWFYVADGAFTWLPLPSWFAGFLGDVPVEARVGLLMGLVGSAYVMDPRPLMMSVVFAVWGGSNWVRGEAFRWWHLLAFGVYQVCITAFMVVGVPF